MFQKSLFTSSNFGLKVIGFSDKEILDWNNVVKSLRAKGVLIVEFESDLIARNRWSLIVTPIMKGDNVVYLKDKEYYQRLNLSITEHLNSRRSDSAYWNNVFDGFEFSGFNIPVSDIRAVEDTRLHSHLEYFSLLTIYFPYQDLFYVLSQLDHDRYREDYSGAQVSWCYIYFYSVFLHRLKNEDAKSYKSYGKWFSSYFDKNDFYRRLPSEQVIIGLLMYCESVVCNSEAIEKNDFDLQIINPSIRFLFDEHKQDIDTIFLESEDEKLDILMGEPFMKILKIIDSIYSQDTDIFFLQEILDNKSLLSLHDALPLLLQLKFGPNSVFNVAGVLKDQIFDNDKLEAGEFSEDAAALPRFIPMKHSIYTQYVQYWYDIEPTDREEIRDLVESNILPDLRYKKDEVVQNRCLNHWVNILNKISAPILIWDYSNTIYPRLNLVDDIDAMSLVERYSIKEEDLLIEKALLDESVEKIGRMTLMTELNDYLKSQAPRLTFGEYRFYWEEELKKNIRRIELKERFYNSRMRELGIYESQLSPSDKNLYLLEMLKIENEIRPYIQFVKKAFQSALPIRRTVKFSNHRHESAGVEFDPDTLFDQEKWIRANVMKVMESNIQRGEAIQINTFCLDFSGSMQHDRMRNLFKILYLLILGLEDRKSFDAFHFFSNHFIEAVNFTNDFTSRKVLFRILRQISELQFEDVVYGGYGATNMSEGMEKSLTKMSDFTKLFKTENPSANVVTSMFVISDGEPNMGVTDPFELKSYVEEKRKEGDLEIKAIFIKSEQDVEPNYLKLIFGEENCVESSDFKEGVDRFVSIMTKTYKKQRDSYKWNQKKRKLGLRE